MPSYFAAMLIGSAALSLIAAARSRAKSRAAGADSAPTPSGAQSAEPARDTPETAESSGSEQPVEADDTVSSEAPAEPPAVDEPEPPYRPQDPDKWPLCNGGDYLYGLAFGYRPWSPASERSDHDHCELCLVKFMSVVHPGYDDILTEGYGTEDGYRWVCIDCFDAYADRFRWLADPERPFGAE